jgi:hypothetical protein
MKEKLRSPILGRGHIKKSGEVSYFVIGTLCERKKKENPKRKDKN